jgi:cyclophilin family peptidyl-prolyl cis-trans isomerase
VFGTIIEGIDVAEAISHVAVDDPTAMAPKPLEDVTIIRATVMP